MTIEDETGIVNVVVWTRIFERFRKEVMGSRLILVEGRIQRSPEGIVHLVSERLVDRTAELRSLSDPPVSVLETASTGFSRSEDVRASHPRNVRIIPKSRDFH